MKGAPVGNPGGSSSSDGETVGVPAPVVVVVVAEDVAPGVVVVVAEDVAADVVVVVVVPKIGAWVGAFVSPEVPMGLRVGLGVAPAVVGLGVLCVGLGVTGALVLPPVPIGLCDGLSTGGSQGSVGFADFELEPAEEGFDDFEL
jgi:hypothetical protein